MQAMTLIYLLKDGQVVLGMKKRGMGANWWNGYGGKVEPGESILSGACRELSEECGLHVEPDQLEPRGFIDFYFPQKRSWNQKVYLFVWNNFQGTPQETEEMKPGFFSFNEIPYEAMWPADKLFTPLILQGETVTGEITFAGESTPRIERVILNGKEIKSQ